MRCATRARPAATVTLTYAADGSLVIDVVDDGLGNASAGGTPGHGITGMREAGAGAGRDVAGRPGRRRRVPSVHTELPARCRDPVVIAAETIRVVVVDDQPLVRMGLRTLIEVRGRHRSGRRDGTVVTALDAHPSRAARRRRSWTSACRSWTASRRRGISELSPADVRVVDPDDVRDGRVRVRSARSRASGFLVKDTEPVDLLRAVRVVAAARRSPPSVTRDVDREFRRRPERQPASRSVGDADRPRREVLVAGPRPA